MKSRFIWIWILAGILLILYGVYQENRYEKESCSVTATITDIISDSDDMSDVGGDEYTVYYGKYVLDGQYYTDKKLYRHAGRAKYKVGDTLSVWVYKEDGAVAGTGQGLILMGGVLLLLGIGDLRKKNTAQ